MHLVAGEGAGLDDRREEGDQPELRRRARFPLLVRTGGGARPRGGLRGRGPAAPGVTPWYLRPWATGAACLSSGGPHAARPSRSEEHTSELQSRGHLVCRLLLEKKHKSHHRNDKRK